MVALCAQKLNISGVEFENDMKSQRHLQKRQFHFAINRQTDLLQKEEVTVGFIRKVENFEIRKIKIYFDRNCFSFGIFGYRFDSRI